MSATVQEPRFLPPQIRHSQRSTPHDIPETEKKARPKSGFFLWHLRLLELVLDTAANITTAEVILQAILGFDRVLSVDQKVAFRVKPTCRKRGKKSTAVRRNVTASR